MCSFRPGVHPDKNDWAPRFGFSYQPASRFVLRGGYCIFYQQDVRIGSESVLGENLRISWIKLSPNL